MKAAWWADAVARKAVADFADFADSLTVEAYASTVDGSEYYILKVKGIAVDSVPKKASRTENERAIREMVEKRLRSSV